MKTYGILLAGLILLASNAFVHGQVPFEFNYQFAARDSIALLTNRNLKCRFSLINNGMVEYQETQDLTTNEYGLVNTTIGSGTIISGTMAGVNWLASNLELLVEVDEGSGYQWMGKSKIVGVPLAIYAQRAYKADSMKMDDLNDVDLGAPGNGQVMKYNAGSGTWYAGSDQIGTNYWNQSGSNIYYSLGRGGFGTSNPLARLHSNSISGEDALRIQIAGATAMRVADNRGVSIGAFTTPPSSGLTVWGNTGLGTTSPISRLDVRGTLEVRTEIRGRNAGGQALYWHTFTTGGGGYFETYGPNNNTNFRVTAHSSSANRGYMRLDDSNGNQKAGVYVDANENGVVFGNLKPFREPHPEDETKDIWYCALEGPEAGSYVRGTASLMNGVANITFPDHFQHIANDTTITLSLTPKSADSKGLAVIAQSKQGFSVKELFQGNGNYSFDWEAKAVRAGYETFKVIRDRAEFEAISAKPARSLPERIVKPQENEDE